MATRIFLIRHGATTLSAEDRFAGSTDVPLSDGGRDQARLLGERLAAQKLDAVYASPMQRTMDTARSIADLQALEVQQRDGLREISHGHWEGMTRMEVDTAFPEEAAAWEEDPYNFAPDGGESGLAVTARALPVLNDIVRSHRDGCVAVVSHKATIRLLICAVIGFDPRRYRDTLDQSPAGLTIVDFKDTVRARLILFNDISHYHPSLPGAPGARLSRWWEGQSVPWPRR